MQESYSERAAHMRQTLSFRQLKAVLHANQRTAIDIETRRFAASVGLVRALGGGWDVTQLSK